MPVLQESIHKLEVGGGMRYLKIALIILGVLAIIAWYNIQSFKNMGTQEAMDSAQLARNIAQGKGYTTLFVRPFSMYLFKRENEMAASAVDKRLPELTRIKDLHPDISNPPAYPIVLAGLMKVLPFHFDISSKPKIFWTSRGEFWRYQPDFLISAFNQLLFFGCIVLFFFLAEEEAREMKRGTTTLVMLAVSAGLLTGLGGLTRYSFGWLILPVLIFLALFGGQRRWVLAVAAVIAFAAVMTPWIVRNEFISGTPFGTAGYSMFEGTPIFPENKLQQSFAPDFLFGGMVWVKFFGQKLLANAKEIIESQAPRLGGNWIGAFFLVGLMVGLPNIVASRARYFLLLCLPVLLAAQALGHTQLSEDSKQINSENLLILTTPLVLMYGVSFFFLLLDQVYLPIRELRYVIVGAFCAIACLPMIIALVPSRAKTPFSYPPYHPPSIQKAGMYAKENELTMSDVPWEIAGYGKRQCVWLPPKMQPDFFDINDLQKPVNALFLTQVTLDGRIMTDWFRGGTESWQNIILETIQFSGQRDAEGKDVWPKHVDLRIRQLK